MKKEISKTRISVDRIPRLGFSAIIYFALTILFALPAKAQTNDWPFQGGEELTYDIKYKYGLVNAKAGDAKFKISNSLFNGVVSYQSLLSFKTSSFFDGIHKMRDTLTSYIEADDLIPLFHRRSVNEGSTKFKEKVSYLSHSPKYMEARVIREKGGKIALDTIYTSTNPGYDLLNLFIYVRTLDYNDLIRGDKFYLTTFIGKSKVEIVGRYMGKLTLDKKYKTHKFNFDIIDEVFEESRDAIELWISDDSNRLPIKLKAKLKIGAAEATMKTATNLKYPFTSKLK